MAAFQKSVMDSTQEQLDPEKAQRIQDEYARQAKNLQRQFGGQQTAGTPQLGIGTPTGQEEASTQYATDEFNRRKNAATNAFELGSKIDTRRSQLSDQLNAALRRRQMSSEKYATKQAQDDRENALTMEGIGQDAKQKIAQMDFNSYKSQTDRNMAMSDLFSKGLLEGEMAKTAADAALKQQDIDNYFSMLEAQLRADFEAENRNNEWNYDDFTRKMEAQSNNWARIIEAATTGTGAVLSKVYGSK